MATLEEIEADLAYCEDVLNSAAQLPSSQHPRRVGSAGAVPAGARQPQQQQQRTPRKQAQPSPLRKAGPPLEAVAAAAAAAAVPGSHAAAPTARTTEQLLDMLSSVPAGQPFEIDTRLLYSPQSSYVASGRTSPGGRSHVSREASAAGSLADAFSLPAYRRSTDGRQALYADAGEAAAALSPWRLQQHAAGPHAGPQDQQQQQQAAGTSRRTARSPELRSKGKPGAPAGLHPASAPMWGPGSTHGSAGGDGSRPARQLLLDDVMAAEGVAAGARTADVLWQGREERMQRLAQPRTELWQRCAEIRVAEERAELQECTFAPKTGRPPSRQRIAAGLPVQERLQLAQAGKREALERARMEKEQEQLADCTFAPQLVTQPERHLRSEYTPLHQRLGQEQKLRSARLAQAQLRQGLGEADLTFQPQLNARSLKLAAEREARELFEEGGGGQARPRSAGAADAGEGFTFSPAINRASERLLADSSTVPTDFQERLRYYSLRKQLKQRAAQEAADAEACTFRPDTGNAVQVLALSATRAGSLLETEQERCERLAHEEAHRLAQRRAAKEAELYGGLAFKPRLNQRSLALAPAGSGGVEALASADRQRARLEELRAEEEAKRRAECTFQPDTSKPRVRGYYDEYEPPRPSAPISIAAAAKQGFDGLTERIADYQAEREAWAAAARAEEEAKRLRECSFAPAINRRRVEGKGPVVVRGLDRHLELRQLAERQRAEAEERAARVFNRNSRARQGATVPQPFALAGHALLEAKAAERQAALLESTLCERMQQCPFKPATNHQRRQDALQRLLGPAPADGQLAG